MVFIVLAVSTSDCGSDRMGSNPIKYPDWKIARVVNGTVC